MLPIRADLNVTTQGIQLHAWRDADPERGEDAEQVDFQFLGPDIISVDIVLMPPLRDGTDWRNPKLEDRSRATIRHRDPLDVVPYFEFTFTSDDVYWLRALAKLVKDRLGVKQTFSEIE